ncbi:sialidase family protein [Paenibacillus nasutitermitis]|uniref:Exo-alpha-sialidase n=1 Tax=Paenibacillus nasutitermitis TaxID=1652958 RepID=A0A917DNM0_9BACL|nr:sialidase family protein [Paenibacillus nasutitermitis]GGD54078.1 hypothetical protein GCM10010911_09520 [Paenibacillus nasutitermitis]
MNGNTKAWGIKEQNELFAAGGAQHQQWGVHITRLAPGDGCVIIDWVSELPEGQPGKEALRFQVEYGLRGEADKSVHDASGPSGSYTIAGVINGSDYEIRLLAIDGPTGDIAASSPMRLARPGVVPGTVINYIHPEDYTFNFSGRSTASPSIIRLPDGALLASHDIYWGLSGQNVSTIFRSEDGGQTWRYVTYLYPCFWGKLFLHRDRVYMLACSTEYGDLLIGGSADSGETWSPPRVIIEGGSREKGGPHKAPMPVVAHRGRIWSAVEYGSWSTGGHGAGVVSAPEDADLLDPANWTASPFLRYDAAWPGAIEGGNVPGILEGNVVVTPEGQLVNLLRYQTDGGTPNYGRAILLDIDQDQPQAPLQFRKVIPFHGNLSKFAVYYDPQSSSYWSLVNRVTTPFVSQRNILTLVKSDNLEEWEIVQDMLDYESNGWHEDRTKVGFQYVDWFMDGDDMLVASRTAINGAFDFHNANYTTFHRIGNFRRLGEKRGDAQ